MAHARRRCAGRGHWFHPDFLGILRVHTMRTWMSNERDVSTTDVTRARTVSIVTALTRRHVSNMLQHCRQSSSQIGKAPMHVDVDQLKPKAKTLTRPCMPQKHYNARRTQLSQNFLREYMTAGRPTMRSIEVQRHVAPALYCQSSSVLWRNGRLGKWHLRPGFDDNPRLSQ